MSVIKCDLQMYDTNGSSIALISIPGLRVIIENYSADIYANTGTNLDYNKSSWDICIPITCK